MNRSIDGRVLLVGEGNFSLSASLVSSGILSGPQVITTSFDTRGVVEDTHRLAACNIALLEEAGATVLFEVDARELHNHSEINFFEFARIIFNFPLADRHNIKKNRALMSEFFNSTIRILDRQKGQVMVTLCKGQGGTPADQPMRSWHDSWQVVSMATDAGLILTEVLTFRTEDFGSYESVGFRFQDKGFHTENALIHIFEVAAAVQVPESSSRRCFIRQDEEDFAVPAYIRHKLDSWSLLEKENHPVAVLNEHIMSGLRSDGPVTVLPTNDDHLPRILPVYKSSLFVASSSDDSKAKASDPDMDVDTAEVTLPDEPSMTKDAPSTSKDLKEMKNRACAASSAGDASGKGVQDGQSFMHGVDRGGDACQQTQQSDVNSLIHSATGAVNITDGCMQKGAKGTHFEGVSSADTATLVVRPFLMPAYVVHKISHPQTSTDPGNGEMDLITSSGVMEEIKSSTTTMPLTSKKFASAEMATFDNFENQSDKDGLGSTSANSLYHLRCSLLENVPHLLSFMKHSPGKHKTAAMSGIVFRKCPINPTEVPALHETLILLQSEEVVVDEFGDKVCASVRGAVSGDIAEKIFTQHTDCRVDVGEYGCATVILTVSVESPTGLTILGIVFRFDSLNPPVHAVTGTVNSTSGCMHKRVKDGSIEDQSLCTSNTSTNATELSEPVFGAVLYLDRIACLATCLPDARLLWSEDSRFITQFEKGQNSAPLLPIFKPFSLYPVRFVHDISFWENPDCIFDEAEFFDVIRHVAYDVVVKATLIDKFENTDTSKTSRCYRLAFQSHDCALSYITSWKLQSMIRLKVAHNLGVVLR